ncbi:MULTISPECIES: GNAT family N-acetyltransferase [Pantoea]|uniref:GNAT family N-acetyltransferase n=1 Tax=Pantoea brenneri TaxID=472694 RepID=A0ABU9MHY6_9GAMM|nr:MULTISPECIES: GNAT family N-acetyltransferase [Pantoea]KKD32668.1 acyltransferase [Pantoea sp. 3.5.1]MDH1086902.1 GNAT family N-acetyltransferase [Pantoea brenneri]
MDITWMDKHHRELTTTELYALLALRCAVFVVEQQCAYLDVDGDDLQGDNRHLLGMHDNQLVAYARLLAPADAASPVKIGRVIVSDSVRGARLGKRLMAEALASCQQHWPGRDLFLSAQAHLQAFYGQHGFVPIGETYLEDGIPHIDMQKAATAG